MSDGETMERLWYYLRRFSRMTKEMRPSHRIDVLCSALIYYGIIAKEKLSRLLIVFVVKNLDDGLNAFISIITLDSMEKRT